MKNTRKMLLLCAALLIGIGAVYAPSFAATPGLNDPDASVRTRAAADIGVRKDKTAVPDLINMLKTEKDINARSAAIRSLGALGDPSADQPLLQLYANETNDGAKNVILISIGYIADPAVIPDIFRIIDRETSTGPRIRAVIMLSDFPPTKAIREKLSGLAGNEREDENIRKTAVEALTRLANKDDKESIDTLKKLKPGNDKVRKYTEKRIKDMGL